MPFLSPNSPDTEGDGQFASPKEGDELTDDAIMHIFCILALDHSPEALMVSPQDAGRSFVWFRRCLPLVCRRWNNLLQGRGKFPWESVIVSVEHEIATRRRRLEASGPLSYSSNAGIRSQLSPPGSSSAVPGSSPTTGPAHMSFARTSMGNSAKLRSSSVLEWTEARAGAMQHLVLDFRSERHDFHGGHALEMLLRAANRGPRGLRTLRLRVAAAGFNGQDSYEVLSRLKGLAELHVSGLPQSFLAGTLPYLSSLSGLTRLAFTPEAFQFPVIVPTLPPQLQALSLSQIWLSRLPPIASSAPHLRELELLRCPLVEGLLSSCLAAAPHLTRLRLDGCSVTDSGGQPRKWDFPGVWPRAAACPGLRSLSLARCSLQSLPPAVLSAFPGLEELDLSHNPDLGGATGVVADATAAAAAYCLPPELSTLTALAEVRLAGCGLTAVPSALLPISSITSLDLSSNSLSSLPLPVPAPAPPGSASASPVKAAATRTPHSPPWAPSSYTALPTAAAALPTAAPAGPGPSAPRGPSVAVFAERLIRLNIAMNRFTLWPQGLLACSSLRELVLGAPLVSRAAEGELERCVRALPALRRLEVRGDSFEPRAVRNLLALQRLAGAAAGSGPGSGLGSYPVVEVTPATTAATAAAAGGFDAWGK